MKEGKQKRERNTNSKTNRRKGDLSRKKCRVDCTFTGMVKTRPIFNEKVVETKLNKKTGKETLVWERWWSSSPSHYDINKLRRRLHAHAAEVVSGERRKVEISLERYPQVDTVRGELMAMHPGLKADFTTKEEENTLFVISK